MSATDRAARFLRQLDLVDPERLAAQHVTIIGAGGIGSPAALALAKMGVGKITIYDDDTVEPHNIPLQLYGNGHLGQPKVMALSDTLARLADVQVLPVNALFDARSPRPSGIVISAVDRMSQRAIIWQQCRRNPGVELFLDGRMGAQVGILFAFCPTILAQGRRYEATLHSDEDAAPEPCTARGIAYTVFMMAALMANMVRKHVVGNPLPFETDFCMESFALLTVE